MLSTNVLLFLLSLTIVGVYGQPCRKLFVTSQSPGTGGFALNHIGGALAFADQYCTQRARATTSIVSKTDQWLAVLSVSNVSARVHAELTDANDCFEDAQGGRLGTTSQLLSDGLLKTISHYETGGLVQNSDKVWTGTEEDGSTAVGFTCADWTDGPMADDGASGIYFYFLQKTILL